MRYRNVSGHPDDTADGRSLATGEEFNLSAEQAKDSYNQAKIEEGNFLQIGKKASADNGENGGNG